MRMAVYKSNTTFYTRFVLSAEEMNFLRRTNHIDKPKLRVHGQVANGLALSLDANGVGIRRVKNSNNWFEALRNCKHIGMRCDTIRAFNVESKRVLEDNTNAILIPPMPRLVAQPLLDSAASVVVPPKLKLFNPVVKQPDAAVNVRLSAIPDKLPRGNETYDDVRVAIEMLNEAVSKYEGVIRLYVSDDGHKVFARKIRVIEDDL